MLEPEQVVSAIRSRFPTHLTFSDEDVAELFDSATREDVLPVLLDLTRSGHIEETAGPAVVFARDEPRDAVVGDLAFFVRP
jgi:hypothetical protein